MTSLWGIAIAYIPQDITVYHLHESLHDHEGFRNGGRLGTRVLYRRG